MSDKIVIQHKEYCWVCVGRGFCPIHPSQPYPECLKIALAEKAKTINEYENQIRRKEQDLEYLRNYVLHLKGQLTLSEER